MVLGFIVVAVLGIRGIVGQTRILFAFNPLYGISLLADAPLRGFFMLGAVFLAVTGAETLYYDMGHFGHRALRRGRPPPVFSARLLNHFGRGARVVGEPRGDAKPVLALSARWGAFPAAWPARLC